MSLYCKKCCNLKKKTETLLYKAKNIMAQKSKSKLNHVWPRYKKGCKMGYRVNDLPSSVFLSLQ